MDIDPSLVTDELKARVGIVSVAPDPPDDFEEFWRTTVAELNAIPMDLRVELEEHSREGWEEIRFGVWHATSLGDRRIGGPLTLPRSPQGPQWVYGHGYGSYSVGTSWDPQLARLGFIAVGCDVRGYNRSREDGDPPVPGWAVWGIERRERYSVRGAVADTVRAVQVARALHGSDPKRTVLAGGSFSGGTAILAAPWIEHLCYLPVRVPTFGAYDLRRTLVKRGSGAEINQLLASLEPSKRASLRERLRYFDAVNAACFIDRVPVTVGFGVSDVVVPGETVAAIYHALATDDKELHAFPCSHSDHPLASEWEHFVRHTRRRAVEICRMHPVT